MNAKITAPQTQGPYKSQPQTPQTSYSTSVNVSEEVTGVKPSLCALCGEKLDMGIKFCPNCGSQITDN